MTPLLQIDNLTRHFEGPAGDLAVLKGVSLTMNGGESLAITGPSGSGKSTLLHIIGTLDHPTSGDLRINGEDPFAFDQKLLARFRNRTMGFVFQDHYLLPQYSVLENILIPTLAFGKSSAEDEARARWLVEAVGLTGRIDNRPAELSGGERQRVALARALINNPLVLLCDEPTGNLDEDSARSVDELLFRLHNQTGGLLIAVTHNPDLAAKFQRRVRLSDGVLHP